MDEKTLLFSVLTKQFNRTEAEISALLYDNGTLKSGVDELLLTMDSQRVTRIKTEEGAEKQKFFDNGYSKAKAEVLTSLEKTFKEKTGFQSDLTGIELFQAYANSQKNIKVDDVKVHPEFLNLEKKKNDEIEKLKADYTAQVEAEKKRADRIGKMVKVSGAIDTTLATLNVVESENKIVAKNRKQDFLSRFEGYDYELSEDGNHVIMKEGKRLEDQHGNPVKFTDFVKSQAELYYEFKAQDDKKSPGHDPDKKPVGNYSFKTDQEYMKALSEAKTPEERISLKAYYDSVRS